MRENKRITPEMYRSVVLTYCYIMSKKRTTPMTALPARELRGLGAHVKRTTRDRFICFSIKVDVPADLGGKRTEEKIARMREAIEANRELLPRKAEKPPPEPRKERGFSRQEEPLVEQMEAGVSISMRPKDSF